MAKWVCAGCGEIRDQRPIGGAHRPECQSRLDWIDVTHVWEAAQEASREEWKRQFGYDYHSERDGFVTYDLVGPLPDMPAPEHSLRCNDTGEWKVIKYSDRTDWLILMRRWSALPLEGDDEG